MKRSGSKYEYVFTPEDDGSFDFYITNGYLFWGDDGDMDIAEPSSLATVTYEKKNYQSGKPVQYVISVDASKLTVDNTLAITSGEYDNTILAKAGIIGTFTGWTDSLPLVRVDEYTYTYEFENTGTEDQFSIQEVAGDWSVRYFGGIPAGKTKPATATLMNDVVPAAYGATGVAQTPIYYTSDPGMDGNNIKITGLPIGTGHKFLITIKIVDEASHKLAVSCAANENIPASEYDPANFVYSFEGLSLKGGWEGWWADAHTLTSSATQTIVTVTGGEHEASGNEWGIFGSGSNLWSVTNLTFGTRTEMTYVSEGGDNSTMAEDWEEGVTYTIKLELTDNTLNAPKAFVTITKNE